MIPDYLIINYNEGAGNILVPIFTIAKPKRAKTISTSSTAIPIGTKYLLAKAIIFDPP